MVRGFRGRDGRKTYTFGPSGDVFFSNNRAGMNLEGTVVVRGSTLTLYFPGMTPQSSRWSTDSYSVEGYRFSNLHLDGYTYVRQD